MYQTLLAPFYRCIWSSLASYHVLYDLSLSAFQPWLPSLLITFTRSLHSAICWMLGDIFPKANNSSLPMVWRRPSALKIRLVSLPLEFAINSKLHHFSSLRLTITNTMAAWIHCWALRCYGPHRVWQPLCLLVYGSEPIMEYVVLKSKRSVPGVTYLW